MDFVNLLVEAAGPQVVKSVANKVGVSDQHAQLAVQYLLPHVTKALKSNTSSSDGLGSLLGALKKGNHETYVQEPSKLANDDAVTDGNKILGHILGSKEQSRQTAAQASKESGVPEDVLKKALPLVAAMAMGGLSKKLKNSSDEGDFASQLGGLLQGAASSDALGSALSGLLK